MGEITAAMHQHHQHCDHLFAQAEERLDQAGDFTGLTLFIQEMTQHFQAEEKVLFPEFEEVTGMHGTGPSQMMRIEHEQMRGLMKQMSETTDPDEAVNAGETLMILMQQHNLKEENMLYPMIDQHFTLEHFGDPLTSLIRTDHAPSDT